LVSIWHRVVLLLAGVREALFECAPFCVINTKYFTVMLCRSALYDGFYNAGSFRTNRDR